jgi:hypothetical protein
MMTECFTKQATSLQQLAREKVFRRSSNLSLGKEMLMAVALLAAVGLVLSIGSSALDLIARQ